MFYAKSTTTKHLPNLFFFWLGSHLKNPPETKGVGEQINWKMENIRIEILFKEKELDYWRAGGKGNGGHFAYTMRWYLLERQKKERENKRFTNHKPLTASVSNYEKPTKRDLNMFKLKQKVTFSCAWEDYMLPCYDFLCIIMIFCTLKSLEIRPQRD